ncbi:hypothetical protein COC42_13680 [Sphingomonas spermidinifaciens]|uniref:Uncharacterized protein n=1 Tax=Sphingomonas spermidinifaciens TaxID=1141889 RepID=A0A2A4B478_9SPHN|nr:hypothetical protein [Sphingomonas spermidinifaciens]PCD02466.1 hypothetical protein COC42_13680 [Sphingomonas spermidinifaciens]
MADSDDTPDNEIMEAAKHARAVKDRRSATGANPPPAAEEKKFPIATVAGIGIGSAALAAALIYSNRGNRRKG